MHVVRKETSSTVCLFTAYLRISVQSTKGDNDARRLCHVPCVVMRHRIVSELKSSALARVSNPHSARSRFLWKACFICLVNHCNGNHADVTTPVAHVNPSCKMIRMLAALQQL